VDGVWEILGWWGLKMIIAKAEIR